MIKNVTWLKEHLEEDKIVVLDASLAAKKPRTQQIPGSRFIDLSENFSDLSSDFPNTMPDEGQFQKEARKLGINNDSIIIVYDNTGIYSAPRVWYMFRSMGHGNVYVLDGGLPEWESQGYETEEIVPYAGPVGNFSASFNANAFQDMDDVKSKLSRAEAVVIDARSSGRFNGIEPEPRTEIKSGHIAGSINVPYTTVLHDGKFKSREELSRIFDVEAPVIFTCGSGLTACITLLASEIADPSKVKSVYDGSWTEWAIKHKLFT